MSIPVCRRKFAAQRLPAAQHTCDPGSVLKESEGLTVARDG
ncbi:MAG: hypothetical protein ACYC7C_05150 [Coriobacteriia bacterium]